MIFYFKNFLGIFYLLVLSGLASSTVKLNPNGGYDIVIGVNDAVLEGELPTASVIYRDHIRSTLTRLSQTLYIATNGIFFINSVELLVPSNWDLPADKISPRAYHSSDIKINTIESPKVQNPNLCGVAGDFIELPSSFFKDAVSGDYGLNEKALLNLWARLRYGVWEEHGYIGQDPRFPYFYQPKLAEGWEVTGCSKKDELHGKYETLEGEACNLSSTEPEEDCRYKPSANSTTSTSLMHFHFLDSVTTFCDAETHDKLAPTKQNLFCDSKSVDEVIKYSNDFKKVTEPVDQLPVVKFEVMKASSGDTSDRPLLYILLDHGRIEGSLTDATEIPLVLALELIPNLSNVVSALGTYTESLAIQDVIDWLPTQLHEDELLDAIGHLQTDGPRDRNFGQAIKQVSDKLKTLNHPAGAAILVIKYGYGVPGEGEAKSIAYESEVIASLIEHKVTVYGVEFGGPESDANLRTLARFTGGYTIYLTSREEIREQLPAHIGELIGKLQSPIQPEIKHTLFKGTSSSTNSNHHVTIPIQNENGENVFRIIITGNERTQNFVVNGVSNIPSYGSEWNNPDNTEGSRHAFELENIRSLTDPTLELTFACQTGECIAFVMIAETQGPSSESIRVTTSVTGGHPDISDPQLILPISIFAKIETADGKSITSNVKVHAEIRLATDETNSRVIELFDNGYGAPDVASGDGIYSGYFVPGETGSYKISVLVEYDSSMKQIKKLGSTNSFGRLLPVDQVNIGPCSGDECVGVPLPSGLTTKVSGGIVPRGNFPNFPVRDGSFFGSGKWESYISTGNKWDGSIIANTEEPS